MAVNVQGIGNALGAMGAGISGNLPAYMAAQAQEEKLRMEQGELRKQANFADNRALMASLERKDFDGAGMLLTQRYDALTQSGGDPKDTLYAMQLLQTNPNQLLNETKSFDASGVAGGYIAPRADRYIKTEFDENGVPYGQLPDGTFERIATDARFPSGSGGVSITNNMPGPAGDKKFSEIRAGGVADFMGELRDRSGIAREQNISLASMNALEVETGWGQEAKLEVARVMNAFSPGSGESIANVSGTEAYKALGLTYINSQMANAKGPQTEGDFRRFEKTFSSLGKSPLANQWLIDNVIANNDRQIEQHQFYQDYVNKNGENSWQTVDNAWQAYKADIPMVAGSDRLNAKTGLPYLWNQYQKDYRSENPDARREQIIEAWQEFNQ